MLEEGVGLHLSSTLNETRTVTQKRGNSVKKVEELVIEISNLEKVKQV